MDLRRIEQLLNEAIDPATRVLTLTKQAAEALGPPIAALYDAYFNGTDLVIGEAAVNVVSQPDRVLLTGTGASFPFDTVAIRAYFTVSTHDAANAAVELLANPAKGWTFPTSFPVLSDSIFSDLAFGAPGFALRSETASTSAANLSFAGTLELTGRWAVLTTLLNQVDQVTLTANPITLTGDTPTLTLVPADSILTPAIDRLGPFKLRIVATSSVDDDGDLNTAFELQGVLTYKEDGLDRELILSVDLTQLTFGTLLFTASAASGLRLSQVIQLLNGSDVTPTLPPIFSVLDTFGLIQWQLYVDLKTLTPQAMLAQVVTVKPWELVPQTLLVNIDSLTFRIVRESSIAGGTNGHALVRTGAGAGGWQFGTDLVASLTLEQDGAPAVIVIAARAPGFEMSGSLEKGIIDVKWLIGRFISPDAAALIDTPLAVDTFAVFLAPSSSSYQFRIGISTNWPIPIGGGHTFNVQNLGLAVSRIAQTSSGEFTGQFAVVPSEGEPSVIDVLAAWSSTDGWNFEGGLAPDSPPLKIADLLRQYFQNWPLEDLTLDLKALRVWFKPKKSYRFLVDVALAVRMGALEFKADGKADIAYDATVQQDQYKGFVQGDFDLAGFKMGAKVVYPEVRYELYLGALRATIDTKPETYFVVEFPDQTLGDLVELLVRAATRRDFTLPAPWDVLNLIDLSDFKLFGYPERTPREFGIIYTPTPPIDFWFLQLAEFTLTYTRHQTTNKSAVKVAITKGSFLGKPLEKPLGMDVLDPASAPKVPGAGPQLFAIAFLALGQRVGLRNPEPFTSVGQALGQLEAAFKPAGQASGDSPIAGTGLVADDDIGWFIGARMTILGAIDLSLVFIDPELYGLAINVSGDKFPKLRNLKFEILYKKINDSVGVYQIELRVPDFLRQLEFGAVSITLPIIGIEIFTNGNFRLDLGFPAAGDFTRSFAIQVLPFTGGGGFYFGWLSGATAKRVPATTSGEFNPVIEAGIGLRVGLGKDINKGILKAGLSLTVSGIIEGTLAFYHPHTADPQCDDAQYFYVAGQVALVGQIYGEINFAIISARLDILIKFSVALVAEALEPILLTFAAEVSVSLTVKINLGIFKIEVSLAFKASISETFTIGSGSPDKCWGRGLPHLLSGGRTIALSDSRDALTQDIALVFHPVTRVDKAEATLFLTPQFTPASEVRDGVVQASKATCVMLLYVPTTVGQAEPVEPASFDEIARGTLVWTLAAALFPNETTTPYEAVADHVVSIDLLSAILTTLDKTSQAPEFDHTDLVRWFEQYFAFTVTLPPASGDTDRLVAAFPMLTPLILRRADDTEVHFATHEMVGRTWFDRVREYFKALAVDYLTPEREAWLRAHRPPAVETEQSVAGWMMVDYFMLLAKGAVQAAIDTLREQTIQVEDGDTIERLIARIGSTGVDVARLVRANRTRPLRAGVQLEVPPFWHEVRRDCGAGGGVGTIDAIAARFGVTAAQIELEHPSRAGHRGQLARVRVGGVVHTAGAGGRECLLSVARVYGVTPGDLAAANLRRPGLFATGQRLRVPEIDSLPVRDLLDRMQAAHRFEHLAGSVSRVLLNGLRPPGPHDPPLDPRPAALYAISGQAFDASALEVESTFDLHTADALPWLAFDPPSPGINGITITVSAEDQGVIKAFTGATLDPSIRAIEAMPFAHDEPRSWDLGSAIAWRPAAVPALARRLGDASTPIVNATYSLWAFPQELLSLLMTDATFTPAVKIEESTNDAPHLPLYPVQDLLPAADYAWAARVDLTIRRVYANAPAPIPCTYELWGADVAGAATLQHLLAFTDQTSPIGALHLLYPATPVNNTTFNGLVSKPVETTELFLIQTNLSTAANPDLGTNPIQSHADAPAGLIGMTPQTFVRFVWESSVVRSGGYYLFFRDDADGEGLPKYLFNTTDEITVSLLITFKDDRDVLQPYMNTLVVAKDVDITKTMFSLRAKLVEQDAVTADDHRLVQRVPTMPPGHVGLMVTRKRPDPPPVTDVAAVTQQDAAPYIAETYNLLNYQIASFGGFGESPFGMAVGPADETPPDPDPNRSTRPRLAVDDWHYKAVVPVYRYGPLTPAPPRTGAAQDAQDAVPDPKDNPYRGIGGVSAIDLSWLDTFGNRMPQIAPARLDVPMHYVDHLLPVEKWPSLTSDFVVLRPAARDDASDASPTLEVRLRFNASRYGSGNADAASAALADRAVYQLVYFQLTQPDLRATVTSTLDNTASDCLAALKTFALQAWQFLNGLIDGPAAPAPADLLLKPAVQDSNERQIYQLTVSIAIARPAAHIAADLRSPADDPVREVASIVGARYDEAEPGAPLTLTDFTANLEAAFPQLAVATAAPRAQSNTGGATREIWVVRFGSPGGIITDIAPQPVFLAPLPLSRRLLSTRVWLHTYQTGTPIWESPQIEQVWSTVDIELEARRCLDAIDLFLSPQFVVPAWRAWHASASASARAGRGAAPVDDPVQAVLNAKKSLAASIARRIAPVFNELQPDAQGLTQAIDTVEQQLLIRLSDLYTIDSVLQFPVTVTSRYDDPPNAPRLFGKTITPQPLDGAAVASARDEEPIDYTFSTSEISLTNVADRSFLTVLFGTRDPSAASEVTLPLMFQRSNVQHDFAAVPGSDYEASDWLAFVTLAADEARRLCAPLPASRSRRADLGTVSIPVPLRAYPPAPALLAQQGESQPLPPESGAGSINPALDLARRWKFTCAYSYESADQDTIYATLHFNWTDDPRRTRAGDAADPDLLDALVQFSSVSAALQADLDASLITTFNPALAATTMQSLAWLVGRVETAWTRWEGHELTVALAPIRLDVEMRQRAVSIDGLPTPVFAVTVKATSNGREYRPVVALDGYETRVLPSSAAIAAPDAPDATWTQTYVFVKDGTYLSYSDGRGIARRAVEVPDLDIIVEQNAIAGVHIRRNETLSAAYTTNDAFIYETPELRFGTTLVPVLAPPVSIDVAASSATPPADDKLYHYLRNFLCDLFTPVGGAAPAAGGLLRVSGSYRYALDAGVPVSLPIFLTDPIAVTTGPAAAMESDAAISMDALAQSITGFVLPWCEARGLTGRPADLVLSITVYASQGGEQLPVLALADAFLNLEQVWTSTSTSIDAR